MHNRLILEKNRRIAHALPYMGRVIDLGCGTSPYKGHILETAEAYIGVDWSNSLHDLREVDIIANIVRAVPLVDECADVVVAFQVMEHLPEPIEFLAECWRILRPNGRLYLTVPFMWHVHEAPFDYYRFTRFGLEYVLQRAGFVDIAIKENTGFWQMWVLKFNYHTARFSSSRVRFLLWPLWILSQALAPRLDRMDMRPEETASYTATAVKPNDPR